MLLGFEFNGVSNEQAGRSRNRKANLLDVIDDMLLASAGTIIVLLIWPNVTIRDVELGHLIAH